MCVGGELLGFLLFLTHFVSELLFHIIIYFRDVNMLLSPAQTLQVIFFCFFVFLFFFYRSSSALHCRSSTSIICD